MARLIDLLAQGEKFIKFKHIVYKYEENTLSFWENERWYGVGLLNIGSINDEAEPTTDPSKKKVKKWKWKCVRPGYPNNFNPYIVTRHATEEQAVAIFGETCVKLPWTEIEVEE